VAGFDLPRLFCGSLGTLGLVADVTFRLHPLPEASATAVLEGLEPADVAETVPVVRGLGVEPTALVALATAAGGPFTVAMRFEGFAPGVSDQLGRTLARAGGGAKAEGAEEAALWARHDALREGGDERAKATFAPASLAPAIEALRPLAGALRGGGLVLHPALGIALVSGALDDAAATARAVEGVRAALRSLGNGALVLAAAPPALRAAVDPWGPPPPGIEVMRRLKRELDPDGRLAPGRFVGGI
jgi:glycolate oxidase FAD binding subunit